MFLIHNVSIEPAMVNTVLTLPSVKRGPLYYIIPKKPTIPVVVISFEFLLVLSIFNGELRVNPFDIQTTVSNIDMILSMNTNEKEGRRMYDTKFVTSSPSNKWTLKVYIT